MAQVTRLHTNALPGRLFGSFAGKASVSYTSAGPPWLYTSANWTSGSSIFFEAYIRQTTNKAYARLFDVDVGGAVGSSTVNTTSGSFVRLRSSALTEQSGGLVDGNEYIAQFGRSGSDAGEALGAKIIVVQS